jgi:hypothetical protein
MRIVYTTPQPRPTVVALEILNDSPSPVGARLDLETGSMSVWVRDVFADGSQGQAREIVVNLRPVTRQALRDDFITQGRAAGTLPGGTVENAVARPPVEES